MAMLGIATTLYTIHTEQYATLAYS